MTLRTLEQKDRIKFRPQGIKRYWIVTSVNTVAFDLKTSYDKMIDSYLWTRDFTTMYTMIPQEKLIEGVMKAVVEAQEWFKETKGSKFDRVKIGYNRSGKSFAHYHSEGFDSNAIYHLLSKCVTEVFLQQQPNGIIRRQVKGIPMGGKASAEMANLFCYSIESDFIDKLLATSQNEEAKLWFHTWRYIDDMLGTGQRHWAKIEYGIDHRDTSIKVGTEVTFLGMKIQSTLDGLIMSVQPKGETWQWHPNKYISFQSCHTHWTKKYLFKNLIIRAYVISSHTFAFRQAVKQAAEELMLKGCPTNALQASYTSFVEQYIKSNKIKLEAYRWWNGWIRYMKKAEQEKQAMASAQNKPMHTIDHKVVQSKPNDALICGLVAINHIFRFYNLPNMQRSTIDDIADGIATEEATLMEEGSATLNAVNEAGNYTVQVLMHALHVGGDFTTNYWKPSLEHFFPSTPTLLADNHSHWIAIIRENDTWYIRDGVRRIETVRNPTIYFHNKMCWTMLEVSQQNMALPNVTATLPRASTPFLAHFQAFAQNIDLQPQQPQQNANGIDTSSAMDTREIRYTGKRKAGQESIHEDETKNDAFAIPQPLPPKQKPSEESTPAVNLCNDEVTCIDSDNDSTVTNGTEYSQTSTASKRGRRKQTKLTRPTRTKRNGAEERKRTAQNKAKERILEDKNESSTPKVQEIVGDDPNNFWTLIQVSCTNCPVVPSTSRLEVHPVINNRCTNCLQKASSSGHSSAPRFSFPSKEEFDKYWAEHYIDDDDDAVI